MPRFIIEREIPNAAALSPSELKAIAQRSCAVLRQLGPDIQWVQSYVTEDKITCVYLAPSAELVREHARLGGFPADRVLEVAAVIDPTTAEANDLSAVSRD
jgi:cell division inhibitor SulA